MTVPGYFRLDHLAASAALDPLVGARTTLDRCLQAGCRINKRRGAPHTYPLLLACLAPRRRPEDAHAA